MATAGNSSEPARNIDSQNVATPNNSNSGVLERRCENPDCAVIKLMSAIPKRKATQFVTEPTIKEKPLLINGFTTVFQVEGSSAKLMDLKNPTNPSADPKVVYRVVPNTHAHIVNYVVVDADGESLRKINENDSATMRKLLESQKVSADQMLKKLMNNNNSNPSATAGNTQQTHQMPPAAQTSAIPSPASVTQASNSSRIAPRNLPGSGTPPLAPIAMPSAIKSGVTTSSPAIQLPMRMHPNLKITAVASAETVNGLAASSNQKLTAIPPTTHAAPTQMPLITPVPLSTLLNAPPAAPVQPNMQNQPTEPNIDKMQAELEALRRTVAFLAEVQAKNQQK